MFNFLKRVFSPAAPEPAAPPASPKPAAPPAPPKPVAPPPPLVPKAAPVPQPARAPAPPMAQADGDVIPIPFLDIVPKLPAALATSTIGLVVGYFPLPVKTALAQLPSGAVRVRFAELREAAAPGIFSTAASLDEILVDLPLPQILAGLNPALLARRAGQKQMEVPADITGVFGGKNNPSAQVSASVAALVAPTPAPVSAPSVPAPVPVALAPSFTAPPTPRIPEAPQPPPLPQRPPPSFSSPPAAPKPPAPMPMPFVTQKPAAPPPAAPAPAPLPFVSQKPPAPTPVAVPAPTPAVQVVAGSTVTARLSVLCETWAEPVRQEIAQFNLSDASVALPMNRLESAMKGGRVIFTWGELIQWLDVPSASISSSLRETSLELPLKVIAPLFMSQRKAPAEQKKIVIADNIPNLFEGLAKPGSSPSPAPISAAEAAPVAPVAAPVPAPVAPASVLGQLFGQPAKAEWSPQEITQKLNAIPGIAASLIAMSDGLLVAGDLPAPLKSETMAAFLPQMFGRMNLYAGEIHLDSLSSMTLIAGQTPCAIFKAGALYLAVVGKPGQTLPDALLQQVVGELAKRTQ